MHLGPVSLFHVQRGLLGHTIVLGDLLAQKEGLRVAFQLFSQGFIQRISDCVCVSCIRISSYRRESRSCYSLNLRLVCDWALRREPAGWSEQSRGDHVEDLVENKRQATLLCRSRWAGFNDGYEPRKEIKELAATA